MLDFLRLRYSSLKDRVKQYYREDSYSDKLTLIDLAMLKLKKLPTNWDEERFKLLLISSGLLGVAEYDGRLVYGVADYSGELDDNGLGKEVIINCPNGKSLKLPREDVAIIRYNSLAMHDKDVPRVAEMLAQIDLSKVCNIRFARLNKLLRAFDNKEKEQIERAIEKNEKGEVGILVGINKSKLATEDDNPTEDLFNVNNIDKIQYLSSFENDIWERFFFERGLDFNNNHKLAQETTDEVNSGKNSLMAFCDDIWYNVSKGIDEINIKFNTSIELEWGDAWNQQHKEVYIEPEEESAPPDQDGEESGDNE